MRSGEDDEAKIFTSVLERKMRLSQQISVPVLPHCAGGMQIDDHWKIVGTGFNTDPQDAMEPDGRHAGIPFVVGARRVSSAVAGTDQEVHSYVFMLQVGARTLLLGGSSCHA